MFDVSHNFKPSDSEEYSDFLRLMWDLDQYSNNLETAASDFASWSSKLITDNAGLTNVHTENPYFQPREDIKKFPGMIKSIRENLDRAIRRAVDNIYFVEVVEAFAREHDYVFTNILNLTSIYELQRMGIPLSFWPADFTDCEMLLFVPKNAQNQHKVDFFLFLKKVNDLEVKITGVWTENDFNEYTAKHRPRKNDTPDFFIPVRAGRLQIALILLVTVFIIMAMTMVYWLFL